jgi:hypothetical protein
MRFRPNKKGVYVGPVAFVDGFHYPAPNGHPNTRQPLVVEMNGDEVVYVWGNSKSPKHAHVYERRVVEVVPFSED